MPYKRFNPVQSYSHLDPTASKGMTQIMKMKVFYRCFIACPIKGVFNWLHRPIKAA
jgi:hypothetical protein